MSTPVDDQMVNLTIDGQSLSVPKGTTVYEAAQKLKIDIPIFCYQDRMPPFGACRMCLVEVEKMPKLQTSCTLVATEGMVVKAASDQAAAGREEILEFLLLNHPLDCPVCDRGGECPLQDQTVKFGPGRSRFFEDKRRFKKPLPLGPVLMLDRERCIVCARCTRFGDLIAGDHALELLDRGYRTEVGTPDGEPVESKFIGNTIMLCPVGALTSEVYRFRARPWDNRPTRSSCTLCPVGCNLILDSRDGEIMRTRSCENRDVNDIWLCDKGWFGYEFTYHAERLHTPLVRRNGILEQASWEEALSIVVENFKKGSLQGKIAAWGGNPLTIEENYLFQKLIRQAGKVNNVDHRIGMPIFSLEEEGIMPGMQMSIGECEQLSFAIILGLDLTEEFPLIWLRLRQAINRGAKVIFMGHFAPEIASYLHQTILHAPGKEIEMLKEHHQQLMDLSQEGAKGAIFVGRQYLASSQRRNILSHLLTLQQSIPNCSLNLLEGRGNSLGARCAGMHPELGPSHERLAHPGLNVLQVLEAAATDGWDFLYVAGANPANKLPSNKWKQARDKLEFLVVQDLFLTETAKQADVVLPALCFVEKRGNFINIEGRVQALLPGKQLPDAIYSDGEIFQLLAEKLEVKLSFDHTLFEQLKHDRLPLERSHHLKNVDSPAENSGELRATFAHVLFDQGERIKHDPHLIQLSKEPRFRLHPLEGRKRGIENNQETRATVNEESITAKIHLDETVAEGAIVLPLGFEQIKVHNLSLNLLNGLAVQLERM